MNGVRRPSSPTFVQINPCAPATANIWLIIWTVKLNAREGAHPVERNRGKFGFLLGLLGPSKPIGESEDNATGFIIKRSIMCWLLTLLARSFEKN